MIRDWGKKTSVFKLGAVVSPIKNGYHMQCVFETRDQLNGFFSWAWTFLAIILVGEAALPEEACKCVFPCPCSHIY